jgi:hypothetical protein
MVTAAPGLKYAFEHDPALHLIVLLGAVVSTRISAELTGSAFPALSNARYLMVVGADSEKGAA